MHRENRPNACFLLNRLQYFPMRLALSRRKMAEILTVSNTHSPQGTLFVNDDHMPSSLHRDLSNDLDRVASNNSSSVACHSADDQLSADNTEVHVESHQEDGITTMPVDIAHSYWVRSSSHVSSNRQGLQQENDYITSDVGDSQKNWYNSTFSEFVSQKRKCILLCFFVSITLLSLAAGLFILARLFLCKECRSHQRDDLNRDELFNRLLATLKSIALDPNAFNNPVSPQSKALQWLAYEDQAPAAFDPSLDITQRYALLVLCFAFGGGKWNHGKRWTTQVDKHECEWPGVECALQSSTVDTITLSSVALSSGTIPNEIGLLTGLKWFIADSNRLEGSIPQDFYHLTNLIGVELGGNNLASTISHEIGKLTNLRMLYLGNNFLKGFLPETMKRLTCLEEINLERNILSGAIFDFILEWPKLTSVIANNVNNFSGIIPDNPELVRLSKLEILDLFHTNIEGSIPTEIGFLTSLRVLDLSQIRGLTGTIPKELGNCRDLNVLRVHSNTIQGAIPSALGNLDRLLGLDLSDSNLTGTIPLELGRLTHLDFLKLHMNELSGTIPPELAMLQNLDFLSLQKNKIRGEIPEELCRGRITYDCSVTCKCCLDTCVG